jgi:hypothetical protein
MNYKVMKRPMFKLGGKANSQGTGVTSGLDEKVNMTDGRANYAQGPIPGFESRQAFLDATPSELNLALLNMGKQDIGKLDSMKDIIRLQAISNLAGNVLPNIESGGLRAVTDFLKDPTTTQTAIKGLTGLKQIELEKEKRAKENLAKVISNQINIKGKEEEMGLQYDKFNFTKDQAILAGERADKKLSIEEKRSLIETATAIKQKALNDSRKLLEDYGGSIENMPKEVQLEFYDLRSTGGDISPSKARQLAVIEVNKDNRARKEMGEPELKGDKYDAAVDFQTAQFLKTLAGNAMGGTPNRVNRAMGTPMMGEQPMTEQQDVAMETQGQGPAGQNAYAMLRARLPQEVSDEVVKLIAYNKEAFADFASIKNQEDVSSFNDKYGVQLVIDVATV